MCPGGIRDWSVDIEAQMTAVLMVSGTIREGKPELLICFVLRLTNKQVETC